MDYVLLVLVVCMATLKVSLNRNLKSESTTVYGTLKTNLLCFCFAFLTIFLFGLKDLKTIGNTPFFLSLCLAVCTLGAQICLMKAIQLGSVAVSALFTYCGFIIPTLWGAVHYQEEVQLLQVLGILMVLAAFVLSTRKETDVKFNKWWFFFACGGLLFSGGIGIIQKIFTNEYPNAVLNNFLTVAFAILLIIGGVCLLIVRRFEKIAQAESELIKKFNTESWKKIGLIVALGFLIAIINIVNTYLSGKLPSVIVFPVINGGSIFASTLMSMIVFKEKLAKRQKIGLTIGVLAIIMIAFA